MKATKNFTSSMLGEVSAGDHIPDDAHGKHLESIGLAERAQEYQTKVVEEKPKSRTVKRKKKADALDD